MKTVSFVCIVATAFVVGHARVTAGQTARVRYLASVYADGQGTGLNLPEGVACGPNGQIVVGDTANDRLVRFTYKDRAFNGGSEIRIPQAAAPSRVQVNSKGEIYTLDATQRRIAHITADGQFKDVLAMNDVPAPATVVPKSIAVDSADNVYVLDVFSSRVLVFDAQGQFRKALAFPEGTGFISELTVDSLGNVLLMDSTNRRLFSAAKDATAFTPLGGDLSEFIATLPSYVTTSKGSIFVIEGNGSQLLAFGRDGSFLTRQLTRGWNEGSLNHPSQMCVSEKDELFIADRDNSRIQVFQLMR